LRKVIIKSSKVVYTDDQSALFAVDEVGDEAGVIVIVILKSKLAGGIELLNIHFMKFVPHLSRSH
jgi:hypothetical protein